MIDREAMRRALVDVRVASDDADVVAEDMLRTPRRRELGPALHATNYREARGKVVSGLAYALRLLDGEPEPGAGNGAH